MTIDILTIFPEMFDSVLNTSILGRARAQGLITIETTDIRPFSASKHKNTDDYPFGGGAGMLMMAQPIADCIKAVCERRGVPCVARHSQESSAISRTDDPFNQSCSCNQPREKDRDDPEEVMIHDVPDQGNPANPDDTEENGTKENSANSESDLPAKAAGIRSVKRIYLSPRGVPFTQKLAQELAKEDHLILLCGHYEGVDQRVLDRYIDMEISLGDYVLTGGELGAMIISDCVARLIPGVLGSEESPVDESLSDAGLLEYPQYTRPREFEGMMVPEVLLGGDHAKIAAWRREQAIRVTAERRPDLLANAHLTDKERSALGMAPSSD